MADYTDIPNVCVCVTSPGSSASILTVTINLYNMWLPCEQHVITHPAVVFIIINLLLIAIATAQPLLTRAGLSIPEALGKLSIGGPLPTYVEDQKKKVITTVTLYIWLMHT